jgi:Na+/H+-translocating membrane pyrophosphatase
VAVENVLIVTVPIPTGPDAWYVVMAPVVTVSSAFVPVVVGATLGPKALGGLLAGTTGCGALLALIALPLPPA